MMWIVMMSTVLFSIVLLFLFTMQSTIRTRAFVQRFRSMLGALYMQCIESRFPVVIRIVRLIMVF